MMTTDKSVPFLHAPWYFDNEGLQHNCIYCRSCGTVHDTIGSLSGLKKLILRQIPSDVINKYELPEYESLVISRTPPFDSLHPYILIAMQQDGRTEYSSGANFLELPLAISLMGKSVDEVLDQCVAFNPQLIPKDDPVSDSFVKEHPDLLSKLYERSEYDSDDKEYEGMFDTKVGFHCYLKIEDYEAFSFVGVSFTNDIAVECTASIGKPIDVKRYSREHNVLRTVTRSLEEFYHNGRFEQDDQSRLYMWKSGNNQICLVSYQPHSPEDKGVLLSIQIRNLEKHPEKGFFELTYDEAKKSVPKFR